MIWTAYPHRPCIRTRVVAVTGAEPVTVKRALENRRDADTSTPRKTEIAELIEDARTAAENYIERSIVRKTIEAAAPCFHDLCGYELPYGPVRSIESITYIDTDGEEQTVDDEVYELDAFRGMVRLAWDQSWPSTRSVPNAVIVRYTTGYDETGDSPVIHLLPGPIRRAILLLIGQWDENREATADGKIAELPLGAQYLLNPYRMVGV